MAKVMSLRSLSTLRLVSFQLQGRQFATMGHATRPSIRTFTPVGAFKASVSGGSATQLEGIIFDMDGTLCEKRCDVRLLPKKLI